MVANEEASANIIIDPADTWVDQGKAVADKVAEVLEGNKLDAVLCVAGGWAGGNAASKGIAVFICSQIGHGFFTKFTESMNDDVCHEFRHFVQFVVIFFTCAVLLCGNT